MTTHATDDSKYEGQLDQIELAMDIAAKLAETDVAINYLASQSIDIPAEAIELRTIMRRCIVAESDRTALAARVRVLEEAITRALSDAESGEGWGPDVTACAHLRAALAPADREK